MRVVVILPTYDERENLEALTREVLALEIGADVLVVDDNSPDGTGALADALAAHEPRVRVIHRAGPRGLGAASIEGLREALARRADAAVVMDADFSHPPRVIPALLAALDRCDVAVASRYASGGGAVGRPLARRVMSRCLNLYARLALGLPVHDTTGSFRAYRMEKMMPVLDRVRSPGYAYLEEILFRCREAGLRLAEVPYTFEPRRAGASKISWREAAGALSTITRLGFSRCCRRKEG